MKNILTIIAMMFILNYANADETDPIEFLANHQLLELGVNPHEANLLYPQIYSHIKNEWRVNCHIWLDVIQDGDLDGKDLKEIMQSMPRCKDYNYPILPKSFAKIIFNIYGTWLGTELLSEGKRQWEGYLNRRRAQPPRPRIEREGGRDFNPPTRPNPPMILPGNGRESGASHYAFS